MTATFSGNITTYVAGANEELLTVSVAADTTAITIVDGTQIGSYLDFYCGVAGKWLVEGILVIGAGTSVPTIAA